MNSVGIKLAKDHKMLSLMERGALTFQAVMIPLNHLIESIVVEWPLLLRKSSGTG
jgi:hypothetical protein